MTKDKARCFGQDLMRGEYIVGGGKVSKHSGTLHKGETGKEWGEKYEGGDTWSGSGTSIFDPVLCEFIYRWFCPPNGKILDPFAGGSVRGIVAAKLGFYYTGIDLSERQIEANKKQGKEILSNKPDKMPNWIVGDSQDAIKIAKGKYDLIFSCPPYHNLEVYSDDARDISTLSYEDFLSAYRTIIKNSMSMLKENRFACFVVGGIRDKKGFYRNFISDTISAFQDCGSKLYNEAILITSVGSLPIRAGKMFEASRKLGKTHQNILVFYKGDNPNKNIKIDFQEGRK